MAKIILFNSVKGGVGKSTLAAQTAVFLASLGRVAVFYTKPQKNLMVWAWRRPDPA